MFAGRRFALIGTAAAVVWYFCIVLFWALQPLSDSVPVGVDYTLSPPRFVSVSVKCHGLFDGSARGDSALPALKAQPKGSPPLAYQRDACGVVHDQARLVFAVDTAFFAGIMGCFVWLVVRRGRSSTAELKADSSLVGSLSS